MLVYIQPGMSIEMQDRQPWTSSQETRVVHLPRTQMRSRGQAVEPLWVKLGDFSRAPSSSRIHPLDEKGRIIQSIV